MDSASQGDHTVAGFDGQVAQAGNVTSQQVADHSTFQVTIGVPRYANHRFNSPFMAYRSIHPAWVIGTGDGQRLKQSLCRGSKNARAIGAAHHLSTLLLNVMKKITAITGGRTGRVIPTTIAQNHCMAMPVNRALQRRSALAGTVRRWLSSSLSVVDKTINHGPLVVFGHAGRQIETPRRNGRMF
jgi:hypothetical protein